MSRTRIKICGLRQPADVDAAVAAGADAIGLVFYPSSPRHVGLAQAAALVERLPPFVTAVGLFVNADAAQLREVTERVPLGLLQFHGDETPAQCAALADTVRLPWLRALRVVAGTRPDDLLEWAHAYAAARGILLDAPAAGYGGGGHSFDWSCIPDALGPRVVLAGGLNARNVADALARVRPYAVDVSSGVERAGQKGVKDPDAIAQFARAVRQADSMR
ncbi:phosphoribosylanthranilate isomerase [Chitinasiproducens palmae]|uniref:N-(5'-phosphoribosyl)anthranilate isomerase n=1 Tax=Chitinasiproducens palmae TaxID=1770053 RepID=A0A1H2PMA2_9BURK|nr:phosphoribosylanthranilate isomerase [Chitinasiproducens palmae]SDV47671.1 phosphoribosylanthranilate isomerase [Chitinasiproducens palmae]